MLYKTYLLEWETENWSIDWWNSSVFLIVNVILYFEKNVSDVESIWADNFLFDISQDKGQKIH